MKRMLHRRLNSPRLVALAACIVLAAAVSGCVIYPVGPGYYHHYHRDWR